MVKPFALAAGLVLAGALTQVSSEKERAPDATTPEAGLRTGEPAPAFRLNDHEGRIVQVGGERDRWTVLAFFPKAMTPG